MNTITLFVSLLIISLSISYSSAEPNAETLNAFAKWVQPQKVHSKFNLGAFPETGLGGVARTDIKQNDTIIMVPSNLLISNQKIKAESFLKDFNEWTGALDVEPLLVWLMSETSNPNSPLKPFFDILPGSFPTHPLSWTDEELAETKGTGLDVTTPTIKALLQKIFEHLSEKLVASNPTLFPNWNFERFLWAFQVINTRSWSLSLSEGTKDTVLVPLADMLNHKPGAGVGSLSEDKSYFLINATQDYAAGEQVFDNYGIKSNYELLSTYGFVLEENQYDSITLQFSLKPSNLVHTIVEPLLAQVDPSYKSIKIRSNRVPVELLRVFRLSVMNFSELENVADALQGKAVSLRNELQAFRAAIKALTEMLQSFPTSLQQDKELIASGEGLSLNQKYALVLRKTQKEILINNIVILGKMWENILLSGQLFGGVAV